MWSGATGNDITSSPAVANGVVYIGSADHKLYAFPANGCGKSTCAPLWTGTASSGFLESSPLVANGVVYIGNFDKKLYAFAAAGCCSTKCNPLWTGSTGGQITSSPAILNGVVYVGSQEGKLNAFSATGCGASTCLPLWKGNAGTAIFDSSPAVANGLVLSDRLTGTSTPLTQRDVDTPPAHRCGKARRRTLMAEKPLDRLADGVQYPLAMPS